MNSEGKFGGLDNEMHKGAYDANEKAIEDLSELKEHKEIIDNAGVLGKIFASVSGLRRKINKNIEKTQKTHEETLGEAHEYIEGMRERAETYIEVYEKDYLTEKQRIVNDLGFKDELSRVGISSFIDSLKNLKIDEGISLEEQGRMVAALDVFKPKVDRSSDGFGGETFNIGQQEIAFYNGTRVPQWEMGEESKESAENIARSKGWKNILEVATTISYKRRDTGEIFVGEEKKIFFVVDDETAQLLDKVDVDNLNSSSRLGKAWNYDEGFNPPSRGILNENFNLLPVELKK